MAYEHIFEPIRINQMVLKNRIIAAAGVSAGDVHNAELASMGGASMVITCMMDIDCEKSYFYPDTPYSFGKGNYHHSQRDAVRTQIRRVHQGGAKYAVELDHVGEYHRAKPGDFAWGVVDKVSSRGVPVKALDEAEMENICNAYVRTSRDALELGYDAIVFDCGSGWLMSQFLSPHYNKRIDEYGGSIENRARFPLRVIRAIREAVGNSQAILCLVTANEFFDDGISFADVMTFMKMIEPYVDGVLVGCGNDQNHLQLTKGITTNLEPHMFSACYTEAMKKELNIPVILGGSVMSPEEADMVIAEHKADIIAMARPLIADPAYVNKLADGRREDIVPCLRCNYCYHVSTDYKNLGCSVNPYYTQQSSSYVTPIAPCRTRRRVVVAGAGPAGLRAALAADACGHEVILLEKEGQIGGLLRVIAKEKYKTEIADYLRYLEGQTAKSHIDLRLNTPAERRILEELKPDKLILAIGAQDIIPSVPGIDGPGVYTSAQAIEKEKELGEQVVIIGGGVVGCELALDLAEDRRRRVTIVEIGDRLAAAANEFYHLDLNDHIERTPNILALTGNTCCEIDEEKVIVKDKEGRCQEIRRDSVVISAGLKARIEEVIALFGIARETVVVGCANRPGNIIDATYEGHCSGVNVF